MISRRFWRRFVLLIAGRRSPKGGRHTAHPAGRLRPTAAAPVPVPVISREEADAFAAIVAANPKLAHRLVGLWRQAQPGAKEAQP